MSFRRKLYVVEQLVRGEELDGVADTWTKIGSVWAQVKPQASREYVQAQQTRADITHVLSSRYWDGANSDLRLRHGDRILHVAGVINEDDRRLFTQWQCKEQTA